MFPIATLSKILSQTQWWLYPIFGTNIDEYLKFKTSGILISCIKINSSTSSVCSYIIKQKTEIISNYYKRSKIVNYYLRYSAIIAILVTAER